jgi:hypothetical protein
MWLLKIHEEEKQMLENTIARKKRRHIILKGISQDLKHSVISAQLGTSRWVIKGDIRAMGHNDDKGLKKAEEAQVKVQEKKVLRLRKQKNQFKQNERFLGMTGMTLQEKSFRNMVDFNKDELLEILRSEDQHSSINKLPTSVQNTLEKNGIITKRHHDNEITIRAQEYLTIKNPAHEL